MTTRKLISEVGQVFEIVLSDASPARLRAMQRQLVARVAAGVEDEEVYEMARQVRRAEIAAAVAA